MKPQSTRRKPPVLVTGTHSSASTLVGRILARAANVAYVHEPFNIENSLSFDRLPVSQWYFYVDEDNEAGLADAFDDILAGRRYVSGCLWRLQRARDVRDVLRVGKYLDATLRRRWVGGRPIVKDPLALLSARWLTSRFDMRTVLTIRHPCAFAESLKRKGWTFPFDHFLAQPRLMATLLRDEREEIEAFATSPRPVVEQAALLWRLLNRIGLSYAETDGRFLVIRHEDLVAAPEQTMTAIVEHLDMALDPGARRAIDELMDRENPVDPDPNARLAYVRRNPDAAVSRWRTSLPESEIDLVWSQTRGVAQSLYTVA